MACAFLKRRGAEAQRPQRFAFGDTSPRSPRVCDFAFKNDRFATAHRARTARPLASAGQCVHLPRFMIRSLWKVAAVCVALLPACVALSQPAEIRKSVARITNTADRKSTRLNSSHSQISYAVFC